MWWLRKSKTNTQIRTLNILLENPLNLCIFWQSYSLCLSLVQSYSVWEKTKDPLGEKMQTKSVFCLCSPSRVCWFGCLAFLCLPRASFWFLVGDHLNHTLSPGCAIEVPHPRLLEQCIILFKPLLCIVVNNICQDLWRDWKRYFAFSVRWDSEKANFYTLVTLIFQPRC